jgi:penicillin-binding protein 1A
MRWLWYSFLAVFSLGMLAVIITAGAGIYAISYYSRDLPDYNALKVYQPPEVTRVYAGDGRLMAEFATEKRIFVPVDAIPDVVKNAFISVEDKNFYSHHGVDFFAVGRALLRDLKNRGSGKRPEGASTITQQVAKNFLLTNEVSFKRKIREAILAFRIERAMSKDHILELYLNQIYLGEGAYGVAAAAQTYFNKPLGDLTVQEAAYLAILPKGPNDYNPIRHHAEALDRRNWAIDRMVDNGYITAAQAEPAKASPLNAMGRSDAQDVTAPYFAEEVRRQLVEKYGDASLYGGGLVVSTSVDPRLQALAEKSLRDGLLAYDRRHGWRGPLGHIQHMSGWQKELSDFKAPVNMLQTWRIAAVLKADAAEAAIGFTNGSEGHIFVKDLAWARHESVPEVKAVTQVIRPGDIIMAEQVTDDKGAKTWSLRQIPKVNGALVAMDPHTGRVLAMQGGWSFRESEFNRATQAWRQPGSSFKPFVYLTALENGFTPATLVLDAPIIINPGPNQKMWAPANYHHELFGTVPMRVGIEKSLNLVTIRIADHIGMAGIVKTAEDFGVADKMEPYLANAIGSVDTTLMRMTSAYAQFVNGGKKIHATIIDRIEDRNGKTIFSHDTRPCPGCGPLAEWKDGTPTPAIPDNRQQLADPRYVYQIVSMLEGVVQRGTGHELAKLNRPLAGKTGTTNESKDVWFIGFSPDLVCGVFVGYDEPSSLGRHETGATTSVPIFGEFMKEALADTPPTPFRVPPGIRKVLINAETGALAKAGDQKTIWESFVEGTEPNENESYILDTQGISEMPVAGAGDEEGAGTVNPAAGNGNNGGIDSAPDSGAAASTDTGGLY